MRTVLLFLVAFVSMINLKAQSYVGGSAANGTQMNTAPLGTVETVDLREFNPKITHHYLNEEWSAGEITLQGGQVIKNYPMRYDLLNNLMEIKTENQVKVLQGFKIDSFSFTSLLGTRDLYVTEIKAKDGTPVKGVFELVEDGKEWDLLSKVTIKILPPNYNKVLDAGSQEEKKVLKHDYYFYDGQTMVEVGRSKKKFANQFAAPLQEKVLSCIKKDKLSLKKEEDLLQINKCLNQ